MLLKPLFREADIMRQALEQTESGGGGLRPGKGSEFIGGIVRESRSRNFPVSLAIRNMLFVAGPSSP